MSTLAVIGILISCGLVLLGIHFALCRRDERERDES